MDDIIQNKKEEVFYEDELFNNLNLKYNKYYFEEAPTPIKLYSEYFIKMLKQKDVIIEIGCGTGFFITWLQRDGNFLALGIDISKNALLMGRINSNYRNIKVNFIQCDAERLSINSQKINIILCLDVLHHFPSHHFLLKDINRVLKKNGTIIIFEPNPFNPLIFLQTIYYYLKNRGMKWRSKNERHHTIYFYLSFLKKFFYVEEYMTIRFIPEKLLKYNLLKYIDRFLSKIPIINRLGYVTFIIVKKIN